MADNRKKYISEKIWTLKSFHSVCPVDITSVGNGTITYQELYILYLILRPKIIVRFNQ